MIEYILKNFNKEYLIVLAVGYLSIKKSYLYKKIYSISKIIISAWQISLISEENC